MQCWVCAAAHATGQIRKCRFDDGTELIGCILYKILQLNIFHIFSVLLTLLQSDLNSVGSWEKTWLMQFNADKCFTMRTGRSKSKINASYNLHDQPLQSTDSVKYLGLTLTSDPKFNSHINNVTAKANTSNSNSVLGLLRRNLKISSQAVKTQAYQSLVRPHLEYASKVWSPHTSDNIKKVEMVQRRAARYVCNRWHNTSSVSEMVSHLGWESFAVRHSNM